MEIKKSELKASDFSQSPAASPLPSHQRGDILFGFPLFLLWSSPNYLPLLAVTSRSGDQAACDGGSVGEACLPGPWAEPWPHSPLGGLAVVLIIYTNTSLHWGRKLRGDRITEEYFSVYSLLRHNLPQLSGVEKIPLSGRQSFKVPGSLQCLGFLSHHDGFLSLLSPLPEIPGQDAQEQRQWVSTASCGYRDKQRDSQPAASTHPTLTMVCPLIPSLKRLCAVCCWR